jgi:hypothetical protein
MAELISWVKAGFVMVTILTIVVLVILAKVTEIRNILKCGDGHL